MKNPSITPFRRVNDSIPVNGSTPLVVDSNSSSNSNSKDTDSNQIQGLVHPRVITHNGKIHGWQKQRRASSRRHSITDQDEVELPETEEDNHDRSFEKLIQEIQTEQQHSQQDKENNPDRHHHAAREATHEIEWQNSVHLDEIKHKVQLQSAFTYPTKHLLDVFNDLRDALLQTPHYSQLGPVIWKAMDKELDALSSLSQSSRLYSIRQQLIDHTTRSPANAPEAVKRLHLLLPLLLLHATRPRTARELRYAHAKLNLLQFGKEIVDQEIR